VILNGDSVKKKRLRMEGIRDRPKTTAADTFGARWRYKFANLVSALPLVPQRNVFAVVLTIMRVIINHIVLCSGIGEAVFRENISMCVCTLARFVLGHRIAMDAANMGRGGIRLVAKSRLRHCEHYFRP